MSSDAPEADLCGETKCAEYRDELECRVHEKTIEEQKEKVSGLRGLDIINEERIVELEGVVRRLTLWRERACHPTIKSEHLSDTAIFWFNGETLPARKVARLFEEILCGIMVSRTVPVVPDQKTGGCAGQPANGGDEVAVAKADDCEARPSEAPVPTPKMSGRMSDGM